MHDIFLDILFTLNAGIIFHLNPRQHPEFSDFWGLVGLLSSHVSTLDLNPFIARLEDSTKKLT